jgi:hypothetical protein
VRTSVDFMPRSGHDFSIGDFVEVDVAELEYVLTRDGNTSIFVGKSLPTFGIEYKERKSDQRFGITPSLVHRYTAGSQIGLKIRSKLLNEWLVLAGSVTNGSSVTEQFHFSREIDDNAGQDPVRAASRFHPGGQPGPLHRRRPAWSWGSRASGVPQDNATTTRATPSSWASTCSTWAPASPQGPGHARRLARAASSSRAFGLKLNKSGYLRSTGWSWARVGLLARAEIRDAVVTLGSERAYITKSARFTGGLRFVLGSNIVLKAEYLNNREYGGILPFKNDVFTSSLVLAYWRGNAAMNKHNRTFVASLAALLSAAACQVDTLTEDERAQLHSMALPAVPPSPSNAFADNPAAAQLGQQFFFDKRFSGPLLEHSELGQEGDHEHHVLRHLPRSGPRAAPTSARWADQPGAAWTGRNSPP